MRTPARPRLARRIVIIAAWLLVAWPWLMPAAIEAAERAWITTDGVLSYAGDDWVAAGGVRLVQGDVEIRAERLRYEVDTERVYFDGNVVMVRGGDRIQGAALTYDLATSAAKLENARASFAVEGVSDPVHLLGKLVEFEASNVVVYDGRLTTCLPPESPGYYLQSRRIDIYPGEKIVVRNVRFVESGMTLFYWPYVSISLEPDRPSRIRFPEIGHNDEDGWYARFAFGYEGPGDGYGEAILDVTERRGIGTGVRHTYRDLPGSSGTFTAYRLANRATGHDDLAFSLQESFPVSDRLKAELEARYLTEAGEAGGEDREAQLGVELMHEGASSTTSLSWAGRTWWGSVDESAARGDLDHSGRSGRLSWTLGVDTFLQVQEDAVLKDTLAYKAGGAYRGNGYTLQLDVERRAHASLLARGASNPPWRQIERSPELSLTLDLERLLSPRFAVEAAAGYGRFSEVRREGSDTVHVAAHRSAAALRLKQGTLSLGTLGQWTYRAGAEVQRYSTGEQRWILSADHQYRLPLGSNWSLLGIYSYREALGDPSPFRYVDPVSEQERLTGRLQYLTGRGSLSLTSGYDFMNGRPLDLVGQASYRPSSRVTVSAQGAYSLVSRAPTYAAGSVSLRPARGWTLTGSARYSFLRQDFDRVQGSLSIDLSTWRLDYAAIYNGVSDQIVSGEASLVRNLGCREVGVRYDPADAAVWLEYRISAVPWSAVRLGASRERMLFDADIISSLFE